MDPHHDGIMYGAALAASEGLLPFKDFFAMYGWPISVVQGAAFFASEPTLLVLRGVSAIMLALAAVLALRSWCAESGSSSGRFAMLLVATTAPFTSVNYYFFPWNSDLIVLAQVLAMSILRGRRNRRETDIRPIELLGVALFISIILWSRLTVGLSVFLLMSIILFLSKKWSNLRSFLLALLIVNSLVILWLWVTGSMRQFLFQYLEFPREAFVNDSTPLAVRAIAVNIALNLPLAALIAYRRWSDVFSWSRSCQTSRRLLLSAIALSIIAQTYLNRGSWKVWLTRFVQETVLWVVLILGIAQGLLLLYALAKQRQLKRPATDTRKHLQLAVALGGFVQVFPVYDWYHVWWAVVPAVGLVVGANAREVTGEWLTSIGRKVVVVGIALGVLLVSLSIKLSRDYVNASSIKILDGSMMLRQQFDFLAPTMLLVQDIQKEFGPETVMNVCSDGLYLGLGETLKLNSPLYVSWNTRNEVSLSSSQTVSFVERIRPIVIYCVSSDYLWKLDQSGLFTTFSQSGYRLIVAEFCNTPIQAPQLFVGLPSEMSMPRYADSDATRPICVREILRPK